MQLLLPVPDLERADAHVCLQSKICAVRKQAQATEDEEDKL